MSKKIVIKPAVDLRREQSDMMLDKWVEGVEKEKKTNLRESSFSRLNVNISSDLHKRIKTHCAHNGINITNKIIELLIKEFPE